MNRREIIRNCLMGIAVSLLPKILQPSVPEVTQGKLNKRLVSEIEFLDMREINPMIAQYPLTFDECFLKQSIQ